MKHFETISTTLGVNKTDITVYRPASIAELKNEFLNLKRQFPVISIISRGNNWGYGCHAPNKDHSLLIDLSQCQQIKEFDDYHGTITIEPGLSYGMLAEFLLSKGDKWIAPVHGAGPDASVLGNTLERGYGITPNTDHFGSVISLKAILESGELYQGSLANLNQPHLDKLFKYGIGPYYDGLFSQSGIGIVTEVTIKLFPKTEYSEMFVFGIKDPQQLGQLIEKMKIIKRNFAGSLSGLNLMNRDRCLSMLVDYPLEKIKSREALTEKELNHWAKKYKVDSWLLVGMIYGPKPVVKAIKKQIKKELNSIKKKSFFFNSASFSYITLLKKMMQKLSLDHFVQSLESLESAFSVLMGKPSNVALKLAYWKNENKELVKQQTLNPNQDSCGLIWYAPLVEFKSEAVVSYVEFVQSLSKRHQFNCLITLTTIDDLCFDSTIPILFNQNDPLDVKRANEYYEELVNQGQRLGFIPYRLNIKSQEEFSVQNSSFKFPHINPDRYK